MDILTAHREPMFEISSAGVQEYFGDAIVRCCRLARQKALVVARETALLAVQTSFDELVPEHPRRHSHW